MLGYIQLGHYIVIKAHLAAISLLRLSRYSLTFLHFNQASLCVHIYNCMGVIPFHSIFHVVCIDGSEAYTCVGSWRAQWLPETVTCYTHKTLNIGGAQKKKQEASSNSVSLYPIATLDHYWIIAESSHLASTHPPLIWWLIMTVLGSSLVTCG